MSWRQSVPEREQDTTGFTRILQKLVDVLPGATGAALVDDLGECVDYAGILDAYEVRLVAAHAQIELRNAAVQLQSAFGLVRGISIHAQKRSLISLRIVEEYTLALVYTGGNPTTPSPRALSQAEYEIRLEGGWEPPPDMERWIHLLVDARPFNKWRPCRVQFAGEWHAVEVIGTVVGLMDGERGFRVRTDNGAEMTLVRERLGHWYADVRY